MGVWTAAAVRNNAEWCDLVCRTHGARTSFDAAAWTSATRTPLSYPDAVTVASEVSVVDLLARIDSTTGCSIKDGFATLDLRPFGFRVLFDAEWIVTTRQLVQPVGGHGWERLRHRDDLVEWEAAWQGNSDRRGLFKSGLLEDERVTFLASYAHNHVVAGAILNRSVGVVGISNFFAGQRAGRKAWQECVSLAQELNPGFRWSATDRARASTAHSNRVSNLPGPYAYGCDFGEHKGHAGDA
jgi:hypothetical protein